MIETKHPSMEVCENKMMEENTTSAEKWIATKKKKVTNTDADDDCNSCQIILQKMY